jgi:riboflavin transporter FmnP
MTQRAGVSKLILYRYTAVTMMVVTMVCGLGIWPASHVVAAETSSLQLRAKTQGIGWFMSGIATGVFSIILPYIYNADKGNLKAKTGFFLAAVAAIAVILTWLFIPEMKGRSPMDIDRMFSMKLDTRKFKDWNSGMIPEKDTTIPPQNACV